MQFAHLCAYIYPIFVQHGYTAGLFNEMNIQINGLKCYCSETIKHCINRNA